MMKRGHDGESAPSIWERRTAMEHYAGIDVSLELSSVWVVDTQGRIVKETKVASEPEALVDFFGSLVHAKSIGSQEVRALLVARKRLLGRLIDVELSIRGILRGFGLKVGPVTRKGFEARIRELVTGQATLERIAGTMLSARAALKAEYEKLHKTVLAIVREDAVCRRLMTVPSVGPLVAITYKSAMDDPNRIAKSKAAGALFGLTPKKYQSGEKDVTGGITRTGDEMVRTVLYEAVMFCYRV